MSNQEQAQRDNVHDHLLAGISHFETTGDRATLAGVLRMIADRLPPVPDELTSEEYEAIYGWGGQW